MKDSAANAAAREALASADALLKTDGDSIAKIVDVVLASL